MRLHCVGLPWTRTGDSSFATCAYTGKVSRFPKMMESLGFETIVYATEGSTAPGAVEVVELLTEKERSGWFGSPDLNDIMFGGISWDVNHPSWVTMNARAVTAIKERMDSKRDLVLLIGGNCQQQIAEGVKPLTSCEFGVGYEGVFTHFCAFESYAWRHHVYGLMGVKNGRWYDTVVPNYFDPDDFQAPDMSGDYLLFIGRVTHRKGPHVAAQIANALGMSLYVAGGGVSKVETRADGGHRIIADHVVVEGPKVEYVGAVGPELRSEMMASASCCIVPTLYIEPFGGVAVEAMMSGTPVVAPDYGAFTETVVPGVSGYRFNTLEEGCQAVADSLLIPSDTIRDYALSRYSLDAVAPMFDKWFDRMDGLWDGGWDSRREMALMPADHPYK